jgi:fido (protein-threonine AMPylation protein)
VPTPWPEPPGSQARIAANASRVLSAVAAAARERRAPTVAMAQEWHRDLYDGIARPFEYYAGEVRDTDPRFPDLIGYEVAVGDLPGVPADDVPTALAGFERSAQTAATRLDGAVALGIAPTELSELNGVLTFCALLHGEWVRIHPFANGNGRTARLWANWAALRYELPPFVTIKPRPDQPYGAAAMASMRGDHTYALAVFHQMLRTYLAGLS